MKRRELLMGFIDNDEKYTELVDNIIFIEDELKKLRKLPHIQINPKNSMQQKTTPAAKLYKEYSQQYVNNLKTLLVAGGDLAGDETSPLRVWVNEKLKNGVEIR